MLGRPGNCEPVCMCVTPGPWLIASVCIERMRHKSSAMPETCGSMSLISTPLWPRGANLNGDPTSGSDAWLPDIAVSRWPRRIASGSSVPCFSISVGLGSYRSSCDGPPLWNR